MTSSLPFVLLVGMALPDVTKRTSTPTSLQTHPIRFADHVSASAASLKDGDLVLGVVMGGEARAYPLGALWDEDKHTVNDELGETAIAVAMCPLAGLGAAFARDQADRTLDLGSVVTVDRGVLVLYDRQTHTTWNLVSGAAMEGPLEGRQLRRAATTFTTWARWRTLHPDTSVFVGPAASASGIDDQRMQRILLTGQGPPKDRDWVLGFPGSSEKEALLVREIVDRRVANTQVGGRPTAVFLTDDLTTTTAFEREVEGRVLTFRAEGAVVVDRETGSSWDPIVGMAVAGAWKGQRLKPVPFSPLFWHAWKAQHPEADLIAIEATVDAVR